VAKNKPIPRPEHPRPQFQRSTWANLNGVWAFAQDPGRSGECRGLPEGKNFDQEIMVPFVPESKLSGIENKDFMPCVWYACRLAITNGWTTHRTLLHFGAVDYDATVWLNGQFVGTHRGGYSSFSFEVTKFLQPGDNILVVRAEDDTRDTLIPSGKQSEKYDSYGCFYTRSTGIWQTVWMEAVPETYIKSVKYYPDITNGRIGINAQIDGDTCDYTLMAKVYAGKKVVGEAQWVASKDLRFDIDLETVELWEPGNPFLYDVEFALIKNEEIVDYATSYFGLREIDIKGYAVRLNGRPVFQRLVLDQGFYPDGIYTAPTDKALKKDIEISMAMGFNGARLHEKVFEERFLYWADKLGYLVWGEYPNWGLDHTDSRCLERVLPEWTEVLNRDFNHPAIVGWCPYNETIPNQDREIVRVVYQMTKQMDPTRPVIDTSGYFHVVTDIYDSHNYEQDPVVFKTTFDKFMKNDKDAFMNGPGYQTPYEGGPYFVSEYGGIWWNPGQKDKKSWGYGNRPRTEKEFIERYRGLTETLLFHKKMMGFCYTQLYDVEQEVNGLYFYSRKPKFDPGIIRKINSQKAAIEEE
jgi:beta-galactosidase/beta-glucuronidase